MPPGQFYPVFSQWNENLSDRRFVMDVDHVLMLHHSQVSAWVIATYKVWMKTWTGPLYRKQPHRNRLKVRTEIQ